MATVPTNIDTVAIAGFTESLRLSLDTKSIPLNLLVLKDLSALNSDYQADIIIGQHNYQEYAAILQLTESAPVAATQMRKLTAG